MFFLMALHKFSAFASKRANVLCFFLHPPNQQKNLCGSKTGDVPIYDQLADQSISAPVEIPRAVGHGFVSAKQVDTGSRLQDLRMDGCLKLLFSRARDRVETIVLNTSGGLTSGDSIDLNAEALAGSTLSLTTQAAERAYRSNDGLARVATHLKAARDATVFWLPQELIIFDGARLSRRLTCDLALSARALLVEPIVFGRHAMGEKLKTVDFRDEIIVNLDGRPLFRDALHLNGDTDFHLARQITGAGSGAMATVILVAPDAETQLSPVRDMLPETAGASLVSDGVLIVRALARDGLALRHFLVPILDRLTQFTLPVCWRL